MLFSWWSTSGATFVVFTFCVFLSFFAAPILNDVLKTGRVGSDDFTFKLSGKCIQSIESAPNVFGRRFLVFSNVAEENNNNLKLSANRGYCVKHNYTWKETHCNVDVRDAKWAKVPVLNAFISAPQETQWIVVVDTDVFFSNDAASCKLEVFVTYAQTKLGSAAEIIVSAGVFGKDMSTGFMMFKVTEFNRELLKLWWEKGSSLFLRHTVPHEQGALTHLWNTNEEMRKRLVILPDEKSPHFNNTMMWLMRSDMIWKPQDCLCNTGR
jgi:hypothetical protein